MMISVLIREHPDVPGWRPPSSPDPLWYERACGEAIRDLACRRNRDGSPSVPPVMLYRVVRAYEAARP